MEPKDGKLNIFNTGSEKNFDDRKDGDWSPSYGDLPEDMVSGTRHAGGMEEIHLGKGLIKPTKVQMQLDGYHFSYEKPPQRFSELKSESLTKNEFVKLKTLEPKVTPDAEMKLGIVREEPGGEDSENAEETKSLSETAISNGDAGDEQRIVEDHTAALLNGDNPEEARREKKLIDPASITLPETPEASVKYNEPAEKDLEKILLSGRQTWYGVPLPNAYRITDRAVTLVDPDNGVRRIELSIIGRAWVHQSFLMKLLGIGNLEIQLKDSSDKAILKGLTKPHQILKTLEEFIAK